MPAFCTNCGSALGVNSAFCPQCGTPAANRPNPVAPPYQQPVQPRQPAPTAGGSSALKIIIILLCCLVVGGIAVIGGAIYMAHRVKQAVIQKAAENGVDLGGLTSANTAKRTLPKPCDVLTKDEVSQLIGQPIDHVEAKDAACMYYGPPGLAAKLAQAQASDTFRRAQTPGAKTDGMEVANSVDQLINNLGVPGQADGGEQPFLILALDSDGQAQMTALSLNKALFGSLGRSATDPNQKGLPFGADIPGLGDKAVRFPKLGLNVLQAGVLLRIIPGPIPDADAKTIAVARAALPKI